jgi:hypothetical protein
MFNPKIIFAFGQHYTLKIVARNHPQGGVVYNILKAFASIFVVEI